MQEIGVVESLYREDFKIALVLSKCDKNRGK